MSNGEFMIICDFSLNFLLLFNELSMSFYEFCMNFVLRPTLDTITRLLNNNRKEVPEIRADFTANVELC